MSSLYSLVKAKRWICGEPCDPEMFPVVFDRIVGRCSPPNCVLVNVQDVYQDLKEAVSSGPINMRGISGCLPPFRDMWLEFVSIPIGGGRDLGLKYGVQVAREKGFIELLPWTVFENRAIVPLHGFSLPLGEGDAVLWDEAFSCSYFKEGNGASLKLEQVAVATAVHALARMNCKNCSLCPIVEPKLAARHQRKIIPASVWHEIKITSVPKGLSTGRAAFGRDESQMRAYRIRGHYADYRNGPGLFGNPKLRSMFWIPEQWRGNEELGQVIPEYNLQ